MAFNLVEIIFNQFLDYVEKLAHKKYCREINRCDFNYKTNETKFLQLIEVFTKAYDECNRCREVFIVIDYTSICFDQLPTKKWKQYLKKLAAEFLTELYEITVFKLPKEYKNKCREEPEWCRFPTQCTTVITKICKPKKIKPKYEIVIENRCECIPVCKREKCEPPRKLIFRCAPERIDCCAPPKVECCGNNYYQHSQEIIA